MHSVVAMTTRRALWTVLGISLFGVLFSGTLTYQELFGNPTAASCPSPGPTGTVFGYPACVYGFFMYLLLAATAAWGLAARQPKSAAGFNAGFAEKG